MVSEHSAGGRLCSVERGLELRRGHVVEVVVETVVVEPVHPRERGELEFVDVVPAGGVGPVDELGLGEPVGRLRERLET